MTGPQRLTGRIRVAQPPAQAFRLFTARGEQDWAPGWAPAFPAETSDDTEPGTVFETSTHGQPTTWVVTGRQPGRCISYAQMTPGHRAGTVTVTLSPAGRHGESSDVEVTYQLTALSAAAQPALREFADGYPAFLQSWQDAISAGLGTAG
ncbi:MAG TPA: SRPBCC family protein [Streptosporangiaceae bacterium]|jgi:hypothetical protein